jgi:hypothetical protein
MRWRGKLPLGLERKKNDKGYHVRTILSWRFVDSKA